MLDNPLELFHRHVTRFNAGVRSGDFGPMLEQFAPDAELRFVGAPAGPYISREAIAAAYAARPPDDEITVANARVVDGTVVADYSWLREGRRAGELRLTPQAGQIARLVITFEPEAASG